MMRMIRTRIRMRRDDKDEKDWDGDKVDKD